MRTLLCLSLGVAVTLMSGCATSPVTELDANQVPPDRVLAYQTVSGPHGAITVTRDSGMLGAGCFLSLFVNGTEAAKVGTSEKVTIELAPGRWNIGVGFDSGICGGASSRRAVQVFVEAGDQLHYRLATAGDNLSIVATD